MTEEVYINPEETLKFKRDGGSYTVEMLPKHEFFRAVLHKFGGRVEDPKCMDYNSWITSGVFVGKDSKLTNTQLYSENQNHLNKVGALQVTNSKLTDCIIEAGELFYSLIEGCNLSCLKVYGSLGRTSTGMEFKDVSMIGDILISTIGHRLLRMKNVDVRGLLRLDLVQNEQSVVYVEDSIFNGNVMLTIDAPRFDTDVHITDCGFTGNLIVDVKDSIEKKWHK